MNAVVKSRRFLLPAAVFALSLTAPGSALAWWDDEWAARKEIAIDTTTAGAGIANDVGTTVVLVRLHIGNFNFESAKKDGSDLRFVAGDDKTPLAYHIEKYDPETGEALIWVRVPDIRGAARTTVWLYWGNANAQPTTDAPATYGPETVLVYHFAEQGTAPSDSSGKANNAASASDPAPGALIGQGLKVGPQNGIVVPASTTLTSPAGTPLTWSAWVKVEAPAASAVLFHWDGFALGFDNGAPFVSIEGTRSAAGAALAAGTWHHVAVVADAVKTSLFVDGKLYTELAAVMPALTGSAVLGADLTPAASAAAAQPAKAASAAPLAVFSGEVDELQIARVARAPAALAFAATGQGPEHGKLVKFAAKDESASWLSGHMAVILKSVTPDGWAVIVVLMVMAVLSWMVMVGKAGFVGRRERANEAFRKALRAYRASVAAEQSFADELTQFGAALGAKQIRKFAGSSLFRLYEIGMEEIGHRVRRAGGATVLSPQSIEAIRAALDIGVVEESKRLNRQMVLLTIAIAGGPFLGLLGTVVGVMITFAAIAAAGDVNVNAIAPGIAAALVATVAGLAVAIPALFGYNWLLTRIKDVTSDMHVFVDEFVTKMAEAYQGGTGS